MTHVLGTQATDGVPTYCQRQSVQVEVEHAARVAV